MTEDFIFDRGYTGHEHLDAFGLINMNGRMYDPLLGRMLSPDNFVQAPGATQGFNRYSYAMNNPLVYVDPDGEKIDLLFFGGVVGLNYINNLIYGYSDPLGTAYNDANIFINEFSFGFNLYTTAPPYDEYKGKTQEGGNKNWISPLWGKPKKGTYTTGERIYAALYIGMRRGNKTSRIGIDAPWVQDFGQNGVHSIFNYPFFNTDYGPPSRLFMQSGHYFQYSLYPY